MVGNLIDRQIKALKKGANIVIGTPGKSTRPYKKEEL